MIHEQEMIDRLDDIYLSDINEVETDEIKV